MKITPNVFEAYLKCPMKCWLRATGESSAGNTYAEWVRAKNDSYRTTETERLVAKSPNDDLLLSPGMENSKTAKWRLTSGFVVQAQMDSCFVESELHAVERMPPEGRGKAAQLIPIRFVFTNKLDKDDKLLLAFDAFALSKSLGREITLGKIIHGDDHAPQKVKTAAQAGEVRKHVEKIATLLSSPTPPELVLNRHCSECEFQARCRQKAVEKDDLSLLSGMSKNERNRHRSKGIFTVTQLSYTFRPRRTPKRAKNPATPRYLALQALAIRENTVFIHGTPTLPQSKTQVYLDIEGLPDRDSYYLIGALVVSDGTETFHSFWADALSTQPTVFAQFAETISQYEDFRIVHFGDYDTAALKRMKSCLSESHQHQIDMILGKCTNLLSAVYPHVYFPTYSNSLKKIGQFLGCIWSPENVTGLDCISWRTEWECQGSSGLKARLVAYNQADCAALRRLTEFISGQTCEPRLDSKSALLPGTKVMRTADLEKERPRKCMFGRREYALDDFKHVVKCAYFDYQREKIGEVASI